LHTQFLQGAALLQRNSCGWAVADSMTLDMVHGGFPSNGDFMWFSIGFNQ
jgi:hypothetical protein